MSNGLRLSIGLSIVIALGLLVPGVTQPVLTLTGTMDKSELVELGIDLASGENASAGRRQMISGFANMLGLDEVEGELQAYAVTRSIWGAVTELAANGNLIVAVLIMLFSIVVPTLKLLMQLGSVALPAGLFRAWLQKATGALSKWSMADVFVMSLIVAFLAGRAQGEMGDLLLMESSLEVGFYWFLAYCIFSIASSQFFAIFLRRSELAVAS